MSGTIVEQFCELYKVLDKTNLHRLGEIYSDDVEFVDALHTVKGLPDLTRYFENMYDNLAYCRFTIQHTQQVDNQAFVTWLLDYSHPQLGGGKNIQVDGVTHLTIGEKISAGMHIGTHSDYYQKVLIRALQDR